MSKKISIINAGGVYAQTFLKNLKGYNNIYLGDLFNNRRSLHYTINRLRTADPSLRIEHSNINSPILLEKLIADSNAVVYFTHDYFSNTQDKNKELLDTVEICKSYNINKIIAVSPIEYINYFNNDGDIVDPFTKELQIHEEALGKNKNVTILRSDLIYGTRSYLVRYLTQNFIENIDAIRSSNYRKHSFNPIYYNDLNEMVNNLLTDETNTYKGKKFLAQGNDSLSFFDIHSLLKQTYSSSDRGLTNRSTLIQKLANNWHLFFHGNTHITNFNFMLNFLEEKSPLMNGYESASPLLSSNSKSIRDYYAEKAEKVEDRIQKTFEDEPEDFRIPALQNYYKISLD